MLSSDTLIRTNKGWTPLIKAEAGGKLIGDARKYVFKLARGHSEAKWEVIAGRPHKWPTKGLLPDTYDLRKGDVVPANTEDAGYDPEAWLHGFLKRQGFMSGTYTIPSYLMKFKNRLREFSKDLWSIESGSTNMTFGIFPYEKWPYDLEYSGVGAKYYSSFVSGFLDGAKDTEQVQTTNETAAKWLFDHAPFAGYIGSGTISKKRVAKQTSRANAPDFHNVFCFQMVAGRDHGGFRVDSVEPVLGEVLCWWRSEAKPVCLSGGIAAFL